MNNTIFKKGPVLAAGFMGMAFFGIAFLIMGSVLPSLTKQFSLDTASASSIAWILPLGVLTGSLLFGPVIDRYGYKIMIILSAIVTILGLEMLAFAKSMEVIRIAVFLVGMGGGSLNGLTNAMVSDISTDKDRTSNLSILGIFYTLGALSIPLLFTMLSKTISYTSIIAGTGAILSIAVIYYFFVRFPEAKCKQGVPAKQFLLLAKEPVMLILSFVLFFQSCLEGLCNNWMSTYMESVKEIAADKAMLMLTFLVVGIAVGRIVMGIILRKISAYPVLIAAMILIIAGISLVSVATSVHIISISIFIVGVGIAAAFPIVLGEIGERYKEFSGTAFSFALVIALMGNILINRLIGILDLKSLPLLMVSGAIMMIILFSINNRKRGRLENS